MSFWPELSATVGLISHSDSLCLKLKQLKFNPCFSHRIGYELKQLRQPMLSTVGVVPLVLSDTFPFGRNVGKEELISKTQGLKFNPCFPLSGFLPLVLSPHFHFDSLCLKLKQLKFNPCYPLSGFLPLVLSPHFHFDSLCLKLKQLKLNPCYPLSGFLPLVLSPNFHFDSSV